MSAEALTQSAQEAIRLAEKATPGAASWPLSGLYPEDKAFVVKSHTIIRSQARIILSLVESIKAAPHTFTCASKKYLGGPINSHCDCWKATAFADAMKGE